MNCSVCGAMVADGQQVCPNCGNPIQTMGYSQPQQPQMNYGQPQQQMNYGQPQQQMNYGQPQPQMGYGQPQQQMNYGQPQQQMGYGQPQQQMGYGQPQQQMGYGQPQQQMNYGQPQMGGYRPMGGGMAGMSLGAAITKDINLIVTMLGGLLLFLSPFFSWLSLKMKISGDDAGWYKMNEHESVGLFKLASDDYLDSGAMGFFAVMIMLAGLFIICYAIADYIPALSGLKAKLAVVPYMELIIVGVALLFVILAMFSNGDLNDMIKESKDAIKEMKDMMKEYKDDDLDFKVKAHINRGIGSKLAVLGVIFAALPAVLKVIGKDLNTMIKRR